MQSEARTTIFVSETNYSNNFTSQLKEMEEQTKPNTSKREEVIKIRAEINEIEKKNSNRVNKIFSLFSWKKCTFFLMPRLLSCGPDMLIFIPCQYFFHI